MSDSQVRKSKSFLLDVKLVACTQCSKIREMAYYKNTQNGKNLNFMTFFFLHSTGQCRGVLKIALFSKFRALWYVVAATQKTFLEYQSDKEKIGFRLVPISCSISENMLSLLFYVLILCCCFISTLVQILSKMRYKIPNS